MVKDFYIGLILILIAGFLLGWLFPVEGPIDYVYDNYVAKKCASKNCPPVSTVNKEAKDEELDFIEEEFFLDLLKGGLKE